MIRTVDACQGCAECIGCGRKWQKHKVIICDYCGKECDWVYLLNGDHICADCLDEVLEKVYDEDCNANE